MILVGDCLQRLREIEDASVQCCVTSPPYFGLRDYGVAGQIGLEPTPDEFVTTLVAVFREVRRLLRDDGTLWLNLGDSYAGNGAAYGEANSTLQGAKQSARMGAQRQAKRAPGFKSKDLIGVPWMVAFALRADGWYLRQDIIWAKPNPMPESVRDRCTKSHEYLFLLSKGARYYFDAEAIAEPLAESSVARLSQSTLARQVGSERVPGKTNGPMKAVASPENMTRIAQSRTAYREQGMADAPGATRNKRSVWNVATQPFKEAHFATFPPALVEPCILAGSRIGDVVLDPFMGGGTTGLVAARNMRRWIGCEINPEYAAMAERRIRDAGAFLVVDGATA
jgi:DNA modification methylase